MAEFKDVISIQKRMCKSYQICSDCPIHRIAPECSCEDWILDNPIEAEKLITDWAKKHPATTNADKFYEIFHKRVNLECPVCPFENSDECKSAAGTCPDCKLYDWWNKEYKEP